jgi:NAD(P)-dependent dehydrogenase (short-subunit alcohol dehydrogenase family)
MPKTVLLTGTSSGIGEAAAKAFLADGWNVVATARDPATVLRGVDNPRLLSARLDLTDTHSIAAAFEAAESRFAAIDVVVNNAGIGLGGPLEGVSLAQLREHFEVNVIGVAAVCKAATAHMRSCGQGLIINVTSLAGRTGLPFLAPYSSGKFAVEGLTEALHYELRPFGIRVKLVEPGGPHSIFPPLGGPSCLLSRSGQCTEDDGSRSGKGRASRSCGRSYLGRGQGQQRPSPLRRHRCSVGPAYAPTVAGSGLAQAAVEGFRPQHPSLRTPALRATCACATAADARNPMRGKWIVSLLAEGSSRSPDSPA